MPVIDETTQIGADGQRYPAGTQPLNAAQYRRVTGGLAPSATAPPDPVNGTLWLKPAVAPGELVHAGTDYGAVGFDGDPVVFDSTEFTVEDGDLLLVAMAFRNGGTPALPTGWYWIVAPVAPQDGYSGRLFAYAIVGVDGAVADPPWSFDANAGNGGGAFVALRGADAAAPILDIVSVQDTHTIPEVTDGDVQVVLVAINTTSNNVRPTWVFPEEFTELANSEPGTAGAGARGTVGIAMRPFDGESVASGDVNGDAGGFGTTFQPQEMVSIGVATSPGEQTILYSWDAVLEQWEEIARPAAPAPTAIILTAPLGGQWQLGVDDAGALTTTEV